jgi:Spy/CpxP family protein refolding chaperone
MNKSRRAIHFAVPLLLAATALTAQDRGGRTPADRVAFLTGYLTLTEAQRAQATTLFTAADTALTTLRGQMTAARAALNTAVKANAADAELDRLSVAVGTLTAQQTAVQAKAEARFYALLTAEQKTKYDALGNRGGGGMGGAGGGPGGMGGRRVN